MSMNAQDQEHQQELQGEVTAEVAELPQDQQEEILPNHEIRQLRGQPKLCLTSLHLTMRNNDQDDRLVEEMVQEQL